MRQNQVGHGLGDHTGNGSDLSSLLHFTEVEGQRIDLIDSEESPENSSTCRSEINHASSALNEEETRVHRSD